MGLLGFYGYDEIEEGDCFFVNHPYYSGCAHSLDSAAITPIFFEGELVAFGIGITHKGDIGGLTPGSRQVDARDIFGEGTLVPPVKYKSRGRVVQETDVLIRANSRTPELLLGDYNSQAGPESSIGGRRLKELMAKYGKETVLGVFDMVGDKTEQYLRAEISKWKDGVYEAEAYLDNDMVDMETPIRFHVRLIKEDDHITLDFSQSPDQNRGPVNCRPPIITGSCLYAILSMMDDPPANNHGVGAGDYLRAPSRQRVQSHLSGACEPVLLRAGDPGRHGHGRPGRGVGAGRPGRTTGREGTSPSEAGGREGAQRFSTRSLPAVAARSWAATAGPGAGSAGRDPRLPAWRSWRRNTRSGCSSSPWYGIRAGVGEYRGGLAYVRDYEILQDGTYSGGGMALYGGAARGRRRGRRGLWVVGGEPQDAQ